MENLTNSIKLVSNVCNYAMQDDYDWHSLRSMVESMSEDELTMALSTDSGKAFFAINSVLRYIKKNESEVSYPKYDPITDTIRRFYTKGQRQKARIELRIRMPYLSYEEQLLAIDAMCSDTKKDREWLCRYYRKNWDKEQLPRIISMYEQYHDHEAAFLVVKHAPVEYVKKHENELIELTSYLRVRLRYPASAPIDRKLSDMDLLYLFAKQHIDFAEITKYVKNVSQMFCGIILDSYQSDYSLHPRKYEGFLCTTCVRRTIWCLSQLHQFDLIFQIIELNNQTILHADDETPHIIDILIGNHVFYAK